ncbi:zinc finger protein 597 isoform X2 [Sciurus carolinensis]|uniref:zinc finger protein 597 isoform X2 n=1 Tax=Sciurus carolinensis TaxID=30640 RepID=UPI001FB2688F|nr:zinc finger protein 597 isoform X2 [Sciurus carolinensis]
MASALATSDAQGSTLYDDLAVYFSQEECVSLHPVQKSLSREIKQECFEDEVLMAFRNLPDTRRQVLGSGGRCWVPGSLAE